MNATEMFVGLVAGSGGNEGKLWGARESAQGKVDDFRQVFAKVVEEARGKDQPARPDGKQTERANEQGGSDSSTARMETASRPERKPAEEPLKVARKLLRAIIQKLGKEEVGLAEELPDEQLIAMLMNLIALLLAGDEDKNLKFLEELGWLPADGGTVVDLKVSLEGVDVDAGETEELLAAIQQWLEEAEADPDKAGQLKLMVRLSENEAVSIPINPVKTGEDSEGKIVLNLTAEADGEPITLVIDADSVKQAEIVALDAEVPKDAGLLLSLTGSQEELLEAAAQGEDSKVFELEVLKAQRRQSAESLATEAKTAKPRQSIVVPLEMQGRGEANIQSLSPEVREFLTQLLQQAADANTAKGASEVATANPMMAASEEYLQVLDWLMFLQGEAGKAQGKTLGERLASLMGTDGEEGFSLSSLLLKGAQPGDRLVENLLNDMQGENATKKWRSDVFDARADRLSNTARDAKNANSTADQIPFLPRTATQSVSLSDVVNRAAAEMPKPSSVVQQDVVNQVVQRLSYTFMNGNEGEMRVFLRPENLGDLHVRVRLEHEVMVAKFVAQSQEVKAIIENNLGQLRNALEQHGVKVAQMIVTVDSGLGDQAEGGWNRESSDNANRAYLPGETAAAYEDGFFGDADAYYGNPKVYTTTVSQVNYFA